MTTLLICGGRDFDDEVYAVERLMRFHEFKPVSRVISGKARGADTIGECWAEELGIPVSCFPVRKADWEKHGKKAGILRNEDMLREGKPKSVIAFPGGNGTAHMVRIARAAGVEVIEYQPLYFKKEDPEWGFLSNFYRCEEVDEDGCVWATNEHLYQSKKTLSEKVRSDIQACRTAYDAKQLGGKILLRHDWEWVKIDEMMATLRIKFKPNTHLGRSLLSTGDKWLIEYAPWGDTFWGVDHNRKGQNWLGKLLCRRRTELA